MKRNIQISVQKQVLFRLYPKIILLENAMKIIKGNNLPNLDFSILGKLDQKFSMEKEKDDEVSRMKMDWMDLLGNSPELDYIDNPEIGTIFITGFLVPTFLHNLEGKPLGAMSIGPCCIFRGLGLPEHKANRCIKALFDGDYLLIIRGDRYETEVLEEAV